MRSSRLLLAQLVQGGRSAELLDQQGDVDGSDVRSEHAGLVGARDERGEQFIRAVGLGLHLLGDLDGSGNRGERTLAELDAGDDEGGQPFPWIVFGETSFGRLVPVVEGQFGQPLKSSSFVR